MANKRIKPCELERYLLGELSPSKIGEIDRLVKEDPAIRKEIDLLKKTNAEILEQNTLDAMLPGILKRYEENRHQARIREKASPISFKRLLYGTPVLAAALILMFVVFLRDGTAPGQNRIKGEESLDFSKTQILIYRENRGEVELLKNGDKTKAGDLIQLGYIPARKIYGVIFSIDGNGVITLHYPESEGGSTILNLEKKNLLSSAYELDNAPDFERFFFVTAMNEIDVLSVINQAEALALLPASAKNANLDLPESYQQFSILLKKEKKNE